MTKTNTHLIVHIGMGKTGSSTIQSILSSSIFKKKNYYCKFLGIALQHCNKLKYEWQNGRKIFKFLHDEISFDQLYEVLKYEITRSPN